MSFDSGPSGIVMEKKMNKKKESKYGFTRGQKAGPKPDPFDVIEVH
jgi:hypothetical protein